MAAWLPAAEEPAERRPAGRAQTSPAPEPRAEAEQRRAYYSPGWVLAWPGYCSSRAGLESYSGAYYSGIDYQSSRWASTNRMTASGASHTHADWAAFHEQAVHCAAALRESVEPGAQLVLMVNPLPGRRD
jgi:hypothetical protein